MSGKPSSKQGRPFPLELKVMSSPYILGRAATYDDAAMVTYLDVDLDNIMFKCCLHNILLHVGALQQHAS